MCLLDLYILQVADLFFFNLIYQFELKCVQSCLSRHPLKLFS